MYSSAKLLASKSHRWVWLSLVVVLAILATLVVALFVFRENNLVAPKIATLYSSAQITPLPTARETPTPTSETPATSANLTDLNNEISQNAKTATPPPPAATNPANGKIVAKFSVIFAGQINQQIEVRATINNLILKSGVCELTFVNGSRKLTYQTDILENAQNSVCATIDIPVSDFAISGTWTLTISYNSDRASGEINQKVEVKVK